MTAFGVDYAWGRPATAALKKAGAAFVCRYLSYDTSGKNLTPAEARTLTDAGISIVVVWESGANRALDGHAAGASDAREAARQARACGMPADRPVYFAVDFDATAAQQTRINAYLDGAAGVLGRGRVGLYGGYGPVKRALDAGKAVWGWQTYAWSGGRWDGRAQLRQYSNDHLVDGVDVDYDRAVKADFGQWRIGWTPAAPATLELLINLGATVPLEIPPGTRASLTFDAEYADHGGVHTDGRHPSWFPKDPAYYLATVQATVAGQATGDKLKIVFAQYERSTDTHVKDVFGEDKIGAGGDPAQARDLALSGVLWMSDQSKYRVDAENHGTTTVTVQKAALRIAR